MLWLEPIAQATVILVTTASKMMWETMNMYWKLKGWIIEFLKWVSILVFWGIIAVVFLAVIFRIIEKPLIWAEEYALISMVWLAFIGGTVAFDADAHLAVDFLLTIVGARAKVVLELLVYVIILPFLGVLTVGGMTMMQATSASVTPALGLPVAVQYMPAFVGGLLMLLLDVEKIILRVREIAAFGKGEAL